MRLRVFSAESAVSGPGIAIRIDGAFDERALSDLVNELRNAGAEDGFLLAILGGSNSGHVTWSPKVLETARQHGRELDTKGNLAGIYGEGLSGGIHRRNFDFLDKVTDIKPHEDPFPLPIQPAVPTTTTSTG